ncbi:MAG: serine hydroxymethyltransferase, partial [bacterium]|nr:serine hydroxymethyltransferase [bacterium]
MKYILFVCTGNTCRSPMAEIIFNHYALKYKALSAGIHPTYGYKIDYVPKALRDIGVTPYETNAKPVTYDLISKSDYILTMEEMHKQVLKNRFKDVKNIYTLKEFIGEKGNIEDPFGHEFEEYLKTANIIKDAIIKLIMKLENRVVDVDVIDIISAELYRQRNVLELIASENYPSINVLIAQGSIMQNKYAEGYPNKRYYGGCENMDKIEELAIERAKKLFSAEHVNVQPHSGTQANIAAYLSLLNIGDKIMGLELSHGGHLSHGHKLNFSGKYFEVITFHLDKKTEIIDYDEAFDLAKKHKPKLITVGASSYSRIIDWKKFREIADSIGAFLLADIAHYAGLIAAEEYPSPIPYADIVTTTTHKTLRGPRSGVIMCKKEFAEKIDRAVFPLTQGGPMMHTIAAKAICFYEAMQPDFKSYAKQVIKNSKALLSALKNYGFRIVSDDSDSHMFLVDLRNIGIRGD